MGPPAPFTTNNYQKAILGTKLENGSHKSSHSEAIYTFFIRAHKEAFNREVSGVFGKLGNYAGLYISESKTLAAKYVTFNGR